MMSRKISPLDGGVHVMALAPARMVSRMLSSVGPPVAMMGTSGCCSRMQRTTAGVSAAAETLKMSAPALMRSSKSVSARATVSTTGMSIISATCETTALAVGALSTTPVAPCISANMARLTTRCPCVRPPPTPANTGISAASSSACVMIGCGVNG